VTAVLFFDPTCHNCEVVMQDVLPPLEAEHGARLRVYELDVSTVPGFDAWSATAKRFELPPERKGVPLLVVGEQVLSGQDEIADALPGAITEALANGGAAPPPDLGFTDETLASVEALSGTHEPASPSASLAYWLAIAVLLGMVASVVYTTLGLVRESGSTGLDVADVPMAYAVPVLAALGMFVAGYLSYIKLANSSAICPIGSCDAVQHSEWAQFLGIPVAYLGFLSYAAILALWVWGATLSGPASRVASVGVLATSIVGVLFSIYLTFLEPFVIGEVCVWCLTSAVIMTLILLVAAKNTSADDVRQVVTVSLG